MIATPDDTLAARLAQLMADALRPSKDGTPAHPRHSRTYHRELSLAHSYGQLITVAEHTAAVAKAVEAEREAIAQIADAYADENIRMAGDSVLFDPVLSSKLGDVLTRGDFVKSEELILDGAIHSAMFHAAQNIASAIRSRAKE